MESEAPPENTKLTFRAPSFWSSWVIYVAIACALAILSLARLETRSMQDVGFTLGLVAIAGGFMAWRKMRLPLVVPPIELTPTQFTLPRAPDSRRVVTLDYRDLRALSLRQKGSSQILVIETTRGLFMFPSVAFADANGVERFLTALRERIGALPQSTEVMDRMARREELVRRVLNVRPVATYGILAALVLGLAAQVFTGAIADDGDVMAITALGANVPALVRHGEWWRLISASFLHSGFFHVFVNGLMLIMIGQIVERIIGPWRMVTVYVAACVGGAGLSALAATAGASVGASTGIFGLLGALAVCNFHYRRELAFGFKQPADLWVFNILLNAALPFYIPFIDIWGHVGGFFAGALVTYLLVARDADLVYSRPAGIVTRASAAIAGTAVVIAALLAARSVMTQTPESIVAIAKSSNSPGWMNAVAWEVARKPDAPAALVVAATALAESVTAACASPADCGAVRDTYATLLYRQSRFDEALDAEGKALRETTAYIEAQKIPPEMKADGAPSSQMARFLSARMNALGVRLNGVEAGAVTVDLIGQGLRVHLAHELPNGFVMYGILKQGSAHEGLLRITFGPTRGKELEHVIPLQSAIVHGIAGFKNPQTLDVVTAWVDANDCSCAADTYDVQFWPHDTSVDGYP